MKQIEPIKILTDMSWDSAYLGHKINELISASNRHEEEHEHMEKRIDQLEHHTHSYRLNDGPLMVGSTPKPDVREKVKRVIAEFYLTHCQKEKRPEFKKLSEAEKWHNKNIYFIEQITGKIADEILEIVEKS